MRKHPHIWTLIPVAALVLSLGPATPAPATFPGESGRLVYVSGCCDMRYVRTNNVAGTDEVTLTDSEAQWGPGTPHWSPDGTMIAFSSGSHDWDVPWGISTMSADGSSITRISGARNSMDPAWSPDGHRIAFVMAKRGAKDLYVMNSDGTGRARVTTDGPRVGAAYWHPVWSPDASYLLVGKTTSRLQAGIFVVPLADPANTHRVIRRVRSSFDLSPDGSYIVFSRTGGLWSHDLTTGAEKRIIAGEGWEDSPAVSPDGTQIAWTRYTVLDDFPDELSELIISDLDGSNPFVVTSCVLNCSIHDVDWQPLP